MTGALQYLRRIPVWVYLGIVYLIATVGSLGIRALLPPIGIFGSGYDDELQVSLAGSLERGEWLGPWHQSTLAKGPGYPEFLSAIHPFGLSPTVGAQVIYLAGCALVALGVWRWFSRPKFAAALYVILAFNPAMFGEGASRVYREGFVASLAVWVLGLVVILAYLVSNRTRYCWWLLAFIPLTVGLGLGSGLLIITRVDTMWVFGGCALFAAATIFLASPGWRERGIRAGLSVATAAVCIGLALFVQHGVMSENSKWYGVDLVEDFSTGSFAQASNVWASVQAGPAKPYVAISASQRAAVYAVSKTAARIEPYLEIPAEQLPQTPSCLALSQVCDDMSGGWFPWQLREAAVKSGVQTAPQFQAFFARIANDIRAACSDGRLVCGPEGLGPGVPPAGAIDKAVLTDTIFAAFTSHLSFDSAWTAPNRNVASPEQRKLWESAVNGMEFANANGPDVYPQPGSDVLIFLGWLYSRAAWVMFVPAIIGLVWGGIRSGLTRVASALGIATLAAVAAHSLLLAVYSAGSGAPLGTRLYPLSSEAFLLVSLAMGVWSLGYLIRGRLVVALCGHAHTA